MKPAHVDWLKNTGKFIQTAEGAKVEVWELNHVADEVVLSSWAKHFRQHYCTDEELTALVSGTGKSKSEFLRDLKFPDKTVSPGPATRSGDFGEILVADYIEHVLGYWCPREHRYEDRINVNLSDHGTDVIGFRFAVGTPNANDELFVLESKAALTKTSKNRLQEAVDGSAKDRLREAITLSALKKRLLRKDLSQAQRVERFQNEADRPFKRSSGAAVVLDKGLVSPKQFEATTVRQHHNRKNLKLIIIIGAKMMDLVHALYERAANEA